MTRQRQSRSSSAPADDSVDLPDVDAPRVEPGSATRPRRLRAAGRHDESVEVVPIHGLAERQARARSHAEAHDRYIATRDAWIGAMKAAASGKPADLAALAIAQEAYETEAAEWERWESGERIAIPVEPERDVSVGTVVEQELAWRKLHSPETKPSLISRITRRLGGR